MRPQNKVKPLKPFLHPPPAHPVGALGEEQIELGCLGERCFAPISLSEEHHPTYASKPRGAGKEVSPGPRTASSPHSPWRRSSGAGGDARRIAPAAPWGVGARRPSFHSPHPSHHHPSSRRLPAAGPHSARDSLLPARRQKAYSLSPPVGPRLGSTGSRAAGWAGSEVAQKWACRRKGKDSSTSPGYSLVSSMAGGGDVVGAERAEVKSSRVPRLCWAGFGSVVSSASAQRGAK